jgi:hypothetical protein
MVSSSTDLGTTTALGYVAQTCIPDRAHIRPAAEAPTPVQLLASCKLSTVLYFIYHNVSEAQLLSPSLGKKPAQFGPTENATK